MESGELWTGPILGRRSVVNKRLIFARLPVQQWQSHGQLECSAWEVGLADKCVVTFQAAFTESRRPLGGWHFPEPYRVAPTGRGDR